MSSTAETRAGSRFCSGEQPRTASQVIDVAAASPTVARSLAQLLGSLAVGLAVDHKRPWRPWRCSRSRPRQARSSPPSGVAAAHRGADALR